MPGGPRRGFGTDHQTSSGSLTLGASASVSSLVAPGGGGGVRAHAPGSLAGTGMAKDSSWATLSSLASPPSTAWSKSSRGPAPSHAWSAAESIASRSSGVPIRPWLLPRDDPVPCRNTGKRVLCTQDEMIRIFIRMPGKGGRIAVMVHPNWPVCPPSGADASESDGRLSPVRELMRQRKENESSMLDSQVGVWDVDDEDVGPATLAIRENLPLPVASEPTESLKGVIERATGIPAVQQKLVFGRSGPLEQEGRTLCDYDIGHGALLYLSIRAAPGMKKDQRFLASPALASASGAAAAAGRLGAFVKRRRGASKEAKPKKEDMVVPLPDWRNGDALVPNVEGPSGTLTYNYMGLRDNGIFDLTDRVRRRFHFVRSTRTKHAPDVCAGVPSALGSSHHSAGDSLNATVRFANDAIAMEA